MIYIFADDLTGAADTGAQFATAGYRVDAHLPPHADLTSRSQTAGSRHVQVIDTETRETPGATARQRLRAVLSALSLTDADVVYKKIDSTMRGNPGVEIDACLRGSNRALCLLTPSLPAQHRITVGGYVLVNEQPLGASEYYAGHLPAADASYLPAFLRAQTCASIAHLALREVMRGPDVIAARIAEALGAGARILVADAATPADLDALVQASLPLRSRMLWAGSAGLAQALAVRLDPASSAIAGVSPADAPAAASVFPMALVSGSQRAIAAAQIEYLRAHVALAEVQVDPEQILNNPDEHFRQCLAEAHQALRTQSVLVLRPCPRDRSAPPMIMQGAGRLDASVRAAKLRDFLGAVTARLTRECGVSTILATGGDTAVGVCAALQVSRLAIRRELLPGIPLARIVIDNERSVTLITKAGGFGETDAWLDVYRRLATP